MSRSPTPLLRPTRRQLLAGRAVVPHLAEQVAQEEPDDRVVGHAPRGLLEHAHRLLAAAEAESDVILWDGGNNDFSFIRPDLHVVVVDALRPGHEAEYYPGETNLRGADVAVLKRASIEASLVPIENELVLGECAHTHCY